ncbi:hypothetical protein B9Z55_004058 [Caenorhabditis nigoni]|uniref:Uncharacterized protein n=1 Tax=Caenorhabditis nigoni TaxID=1611254 RepID=A0A2G5UV72_9PELO|nr:hypothetical protein B9Z55_004058 [Caenorhabditis nigoni]
MNRMTMLEKGCEPIASTAPKNSYMKSPKIGCCSSEGDKGKNNEVLKTFRTVRVRNSIVNNIPATKNGFRDVAQVFFRLKKKNDGLGNGQFPIGKAVEYPKNMRKKRWH